MIRKYSPALLLLFLIFNFQNAAGQNYQREVLNKLLDYHSTPKEIAYLHLNKSILLQGEQLGISAYVMLQKDFKPSLETTNLYVQVKDSNDVVIKEKMLLIDRGTGADTFDIDSTFTNGTYSIVAFTNWMRNFKQQYFFTEKIQVIESNLGFEEKKIDNLHKIDAQFLSESGHLLKNTVNNLGIAIKDSLGYGLSDASVQIKDKKNRIIGETKLNRFGIGSISFTPKIEEEYVALINYKGRNFTEIIDTEIEDQGILIATVNKENAVEIVLKTNSETIENFGKDPFILSIQNPGKAITYQVTFNDEKAMSLEVPYTDLNSGINIITLFDKNKRPVAERLFFNYNDLKVEELEKPIFVDQNDSLRLTIPTKKLADSTFLSVSILPENTISDHRNHNIISYMMLQPFVNGTIEDASWYFRDIDSEKKTALDLLLLTQGWSSYDWTEIFMKVNKFPKYQFEKYVHLTARANGDNDKDRRFLIHASSTNPPTYIDLPAGKDSFMVEEVIPMEEEKLFISKVRRKDALAPAGIAVQFYPNHIEELKHDAKGLVQKSHLFSEKLDPGFSYFNDFAKGLEQLDEVLIETKIDKIIARERKLSNHAWGKVDVLDDEEKMMFNTLAGYLIAQGLRVSESPDQFVVETSLSQQSSESAGTPDAGFDETFTGTADTSGIEESRGLAIFMDGMPLFNKGMLYQYPLSNIDYIEINRTGMGNGFIGSRGSIKIYSDFDVSFNRNYRNRLQEFEFPVAYASKKKFYVPQYSNKKDTFFQEYGVIDWKSDLMAGKGENIAIEFAKPEVDFKLIIEGFTASGDLIYDVKSISVN
ncbi:hypothetical protein C8P64_1229 [Christiangramia gaetbulicola]|uniref:TonB-dependent receptor-like protein n=1 Tax=Christiangramia gaetbulicola TaxID=703340 RepID=A0A2T6AN73_9FLAO|nr:hypothetical protein [Christiangramia gaetbulicola]PTX45237.1 hypothetical protein C8P64_1229 [Christiangramia gaetbulicola]